MRTDRIFAWLMPMQWIGGIVAALCISPWTWNGAVREVHPHVLAAIFLGGAITFWPVYCAWKRSGRTSTRHIVAVGQIFMSALLIHLSGGRIETHFHVFGSLAFLAFYRDWRVLVSASLVVAVDHFVRGIYFPLSVFGTLTASPYRWVEHAAWVVFEDIFLIISIRQSLAEMLGIAERQAALEELNMGVERKVKERTAELTREISERKKVEEQLEQIRYDNVLIFNSIGEGIHRIDRDGVIVFENRASAEMLGWNISELIGQPAHSTMHHSHEDGSPYPRHECVIYATLNTGEVRHVEDEVFWRKDGTCFPVDYTVNPVRNEDGEVVGAVVVFSDITGRKKAEEEQKRLTAQLAKERERFATILDSIPIVVFENFTNGEGHHQFVSGYVEKMYGYTPEEWTSEPQFWSRCVHPDDELLVKTATEVLRSTGTVVEQWRWIAKDGHVLWGETYISVLRDEAGNHLGVRGITIDITQRKMAEQGLEEAGYRLVEASRKAGMAEVATNVLHNVGNVLNSVNVSHSVITEKVLKSRVSGVAKTAELLQQHALDIGAFLASDPVGQKIPEYLGKLASRLLQEQERILSELQVLGQNIAHVKEIIAVQQNYARAGGVHEIVAIRELVEEALTINSPALTRHRIELIRDYHAVPPISLEKHKVLQILVNLISNAKHALGDCNCNDKQLLIRIAQNGADCVKVSVIDNGVGISAENLTRIFAHGFTTRKDGHGFGLHSGVLAAREMGGKLTAHSDGPDTGATFTLELPLKGAG